MSANAPPPLPPPAGEPPPLTKKQRVVYGGLAALVVAGLIALGVFFLLVKRPEPKSPVEAVPTIWKTARETPMHMRHVGKEKIVCTDCHVTEGVAPTDASCGKCHEKEEKSHHVGAKEAHPNLPAGTTATTACLSCHVFGANKPTAQCLDCHQTNASVSPLPQHASKDALCNRCHAMHSPNKNKVRDTTALTDCRGCHEKAHATHGGSVKIASIPDGGVGRLAAGGAGGGDAGDAGDAGGPGVRFADSADALRVCTSCHTPHKKKEVAKNACASCHVNAPKKDAAVTLLASIAPPAIAPHGPKVASHDACVTCHEPHDVRRDAARQACAACHANHREALFSSEHGSGADHTATGHRACIACHAPHAPNRELARGSCTSSGSCHTDAQHTSAVALGGARIKEHAECTNCHDPHRAKVKGGVSPAQACVRCHTSTKPSHPAAAENGGACIGCHSPHKPNTTTSNANAAASKHGGAPFASDCSTSSCHGAIASSDHALHAKNRVRCVECHKPHAFKLDALVATPTQTPTALCARCHAGEATKTAASPHAGHAQCTSCHASGAPKTAAHSPNAKPAMPVACESCHAAEVHSAPQGHAKACTTCHDPHSGQRAPSNLAAMGGAACTSAGGCHENKKTALHVKLAPVENCTTSCHRPHGPKGPDKPPACLTCHAPDSLRGLHQVAAHTHANGSTSEAMSAAACSTCHSPHGPPRADRATCTSTCHADRKTHQPDAAVCKGCHLFRR